MGEGSPKHPGKLLAERFLAPLGVSSSELAQALLVEESLIDAFLVGEIAINADLALRLGMFLDVPALWWLEMQVRFDVESAPDRDRIAREVQPFSGLEDFVVTRTEARPLQHRTEPGPHVELLSVSSELLARLRAQVELSVPRRSRKVEEIAFENEALALIGRTD